MMAQFLIILCMCCLSFSALAQDIAAKVIKSKGSVTAISESTGSRALQRGSDVFPNEAVHTGEDAYVTLRFTDGTVFDLAASSTVKINDYLYAKDKPGNDKFSSELIEGGFRAITGSIGIRSPKSFKTKVRMTTLTVRGTGFACGVGGQRFAQCADISIVPQDGSAPPLQKNNKSDACDYLKTDNNPTDPVVISVIQGGIFVDYQDEEYPLEEDSDQKTIRVTKGDVDISPDVPSFNKLGFDFPSDMSDFIKEVAALPPQSTPSDTPTYRPTGGGGAGSPPAGSEPCGVCDAVKGALDTAPAKPVY